LKNILILYPHFPPSNLAGIHRPRLFAQHLPAFGWNPIILTVHEKYYEEALDYNLEKLLPPALRIEKVNAFSTGKLRLIGDLGLLAFFQLYKRAKQLIQSEKIDFLYIPIPSFYCALLGRWLHHSTGVKYGIDYIDPWVHEFPGSDKMFSRHWFSTKMARLLEPIAVKNASLITGVAAGYYTAVLERNPHLKSRAVYGAMPYGAEQGDYDLLKQLDLKPYLFKKTNKILLVYAGAMLPKAFGPLEAIFKSIQAAPEIFKELEFHFIGTGKTTYDPEGYNIKRLAEQYGLWQTIVFEYPMRIPYLDVLVHLNAADGVFILGSTEPHYTPSKVYQGILSNKPILAVLHNQSTAVTVLQKSGGGLVLGFDGEDGLQVIENNFPSLAAQYVEWIKNFDATNIHKEIFETYSARNITKQLADLLNQVVK
jgi:glycosyltransferase involved in cell wall biosynthesis